MPLFLLFVILPIVEIFLIIEVKDVIGGWNTLGLVILTAFAGSYLLRRQGWKTLQSLQEKTARGELPAVELIEAVLLFVGGALLLTPGFVTDAFGLACLLPGSRQLMARYLLSKGLVSANNRFFYYQSGSSFNQDPFRQDPFSQDPFGGGEGPFSSSGQDSAQERSVEHDHHNHHHQDSHDSDSPIEGEYIPRRRR